MTKQQKTWCPICGPNISVDEDGLCMTCGATATGEGADLAHKYWEDSKRLDWLSQMTGYHNVRKTVDEHRNKMR